MGNNFAKFQGMENAWGKKVRPSIIWESYGKTISIPFPHMWYVVCLDYRKAFDLVDHGTLAAKIMGLRIPRGVARWVCDFLMDRRQRVKLSSDWFSEWGAVPSAVPQGTKLGP